MSELANRIGPLDRNTPVFIAGHRGLVGSALVRTFTAAGFTNFVTATRAELDLRNQPDVLAFIAAKKPGVVIDAAAKVGGIIANNTYPADFLVDNLQIQTNLLDAARINEVPRVLFLGSSCIYPRLSPQPISENALMTGPLEPTNEAYAIAKIAGLMHVKAIRKQYGLPYISAMPTNLYGPGDNYHPENSHVIPGMLRRYHEAKVAGLPEISNWGTGAPRREFLHVDDLAAACLFLLENYDGDDAINVGVGQDHALTEVAELIQETVGYPGKVLWDSSKPDGMPRKLLDVSAINNLGWQAKIRLREGLASTYQHVLENHTLD